MQVKQAYFDAAGNAQELSIVTYHQAPISSATPFSDCTRWPYNVAQHFVNNLAPIIKTQYLAEYHDNNQMVDMGMVQQLQYLRTLLARLIQCERKLASSKVMIRGEISNHAMFVNHQPSGILLSQAEGTLQRHDRSSPATSPRKFKSECWGCGAKGPNAHVYRDKATGKILCPHAHKPEVSQRAERMKNDFSSVGRLVSRSMSNVPMSSSLISPIVRRLLLVLISQQRRINRSVISICFFSSRCCSSILHVDASGLSCNVVSSSPASSGHQPYSPSRTSSRACKRMISVDYFQEIIHTSCFTPQPSQPAPCPSPWLAVILSTSKHRFPRSSLVSSDQSS
jgi:hypothetical protein